MSANDLYQPPLIMGEKHVLCLDLINLTWLDYSLYHLIIVTYVGPEKVIN